LRGLAAPGGDVDNEENVPGVVGEAARRAVDLAQRDVEKGAHHGQVQFSRIVIGGRKVSDSE